MKVLNPGSAAEALARALKKPILYLSFGDVKDFAEIEKAAPYLRFREDTDYMQAISDGFAIIVCDSDAERDRLFDLTVGDDGPTNANNYNGPMRIYAMTIDKTGQTLNENT